MKVKTAKRMINWLWLGLGKQHEMDTVQVTKWREISFTMETSASFLNRRLSNETDSLL